MRFLKLTLILPLIGLLTACQSTGEQQMVSRASAETVVVGYIPANAGNIDVESRISHLPSSRQIVWLYENYDRLLRKGQIATGMPVEIVAYGRDMNTVIWRDQSVSSGMRRVEMPKHIARQTGIICARVTGYRILNVENVQMGKNQTSWCDEDFASYVDESWMQGEDGGYGFPLLLEPLSFSEGV